MRETGSMGYRPPLMTMKGYRRSQCAFRDPPPSAAVWPETFPGSGGRPRLCFMPIKTQTWP